VDLLDEGPIACTRNSLLLDPVCNTFERLYSRLAQLAMLRVVELRCYFDQDLRRNGNDIPHVAPVGDHRLVVEAPLWHVLQKRRRVYVAHLVVSDRDIILATLVDVCTLHEETLHEGFPDGHCEIGSLVHLELAKSTIANNARELLPDALSLLQASLLQEIVLAERCPGALLVMELRKDIEQSEMVPCTYSEGPVSSVGCLLGPPWALEHRWHRQHGCDCQGLVYASTVSCRNNCPAKMRIHRKLGHVPANVSDVAFIVHGTKKM